MEAWAIFKAKTQANLFLLNCPPDAERVESGGQEGGVDVSRLPVEDLVADDDDAGVAGESGFVGLVNAAAAGTQICDSRGGGSCVSFVVGGGGALRHCGFGDREGVPVARGRRNAALLALSIAEYRTKEEMPEPEMHV